MNKLNYDKKTVPFESIPIGGMFRYKQKVYMRIENVFRPVEDYYTIVINYDFKYCIDGNFYPVYDLAVNLSNGTIDSFENSVEVDVIKIDKIKIEVDI